MTLVHDRHFTMTTALALGDSRCRRFAVPGRTVFIASERGVELMLAVEGRLRQNMTNLYAVQVLLLVFVLRLRTLRQIAVKCCNVLVVKAVHKPAHTL